MQGPQNVIFESPCKPKWIERKKYETLSSSSKNFGSQKTYKGGRRPKAATPFVCFSATQNCSDWCLSLVFFPFNPFWLAGAPNNYILGTLDLLKNLILFWGHFLGYFLGSFLAFDNKWEVATFLIPQTVLALWGSGA